MMISEGYKANFETLKRAGNNGDLALMECTVKATGETAILLCAAYLEGEDYVFSPLARMEDGNPYERYDPPGEETGTNSP